MSQLKAIQDVLLTDASTGYFPEGYIGDQILPFRKVELSSGKIAAYGKEHLRIERSYTGGRGKYRRVEGVARSTLSYQIESHGLSGIVTEDDYRNVQQPFDAEKDETLGLTSKIMLEKEKAIADVMTSTSIITQNVTLVGVQQYNDRANSDPLGDFLTARKTIYAGCGFAPNYAEMDWLTFNALAIHPGILDALGFTQQRAGQLNEAEMAKALGVEKLLIGRVQYNSAKEGQSDVLAPIWGKNIVMWYRPQAAGKYQQSLGYQFGYANQRRVFKNAVTNPPNSNEILVDDHYDWVLTDVTAAYLIKNSIA